MWTWKPMPEDVDKKEQWLKAACLAISCVMLGWTFFIGGNAVAETMLSPNDVATPRETETLDAHSDIPMDPEPDPEPEAESQKPSAKKTPKKQPKQESDLQTAVLPAETQADIPEEEYVEPLVEDDSCEEEATFYEDDDTYTEVLVDSDIPEDSGQGYYTSDEFMSEGEVYDDGQRFTWYSQNVLPGEGLDIPGRHVEDGYVVDGDGCVVLAGTDEQQGMEMDIPFGTGTGKVYDTIEEYDGTIDVYTDF
jgi:hypothetical protein